MARFSHEWNHFFQGDHGSATKLIAFNTNHHNDWLVVSTNPSEKWWSEFVSWDDFPFPIYEKKIQTTNQISINHHYPPLTTNQMIIISRFSKVLQEADIIAAPMLHPLQHGESQRSWHRSTLSAGEFSCKPCVITRCAIHIVRQCTSTCIMYIYI